MSLKVLLADDHPLVRYGLKSAIEKRCNDIKVVGKASNGKEVLEIARNNLVDVYILDISMPILNGIETASRLIKMDPRSKIIILSIHDKRIFVEKALKSGARGYLLKDSASEEVIRAIREVHMGRFYLSPAISKFIVNGFLENINNCNKNGEEVNLTKREREILKLIAEGFTNKDIARKLDLSLYAVHVHRKNIMKKLDIHNHADVVRYAIKEGISEL